MKYILLLMVGFYSINAISQIAEKPKYKYEFTVAKDGSGDFQYIQDAIDAMRGYSLAPLTLYIKNGVYKEKLLLSETKMDITFIGEDVNKTIISFDDYSGRGSITTSSSYTIKVTGNRFTAQNITFENSAGRVGQAVAMYVEADQVSFCNCRFLGNQDTIFTGGEYSRQLYDSCYIEGTVDFIFGPATALFTHCTILCKDNAFITAASTTMGKPFGYVFMDCKILADTSVTKVYLGRPWRQYAKTVFIRCELPNAIAAEGWDNWSNAENEKTAFYAEYNNSGPGNRPSQRIGWSHQLTAKQAAAYTRENIFSLADAASRPNSDWFKTKARKAFVWPAKSEKQ